MCFACSEVLHICILEVWTQALGLQSNSRDVNLPVLCSKIAQTGPLPPAAANSVSWFSSFLAIRKGDRRGSGMRVTAERAGGFVKLTLTLPQTLPIPCSWDFLSCDHPRLRKQRLVSCRKVGRLSKEVRKHAQFWLVKVQKIEIRTQAS